MADGTVGLSVIAAGAKALQKFVQKLLGITDLQQRIGELEKQMAFIQNLVTSVLGTMGKYRDKTEDQLSLFKTQIESLLKTIDEFMASTEKDCEEASAGRMSGYLDQARALRQKLRLNRTLIEKHLNN